MRSVYKLILLGIVFLGFASSSEALDWEACRTDMRKATFGKPMFACNTTIYSSTQFTSSWGPCSLFGSNMILDRIEFIGKNYERLQMEASRGRGYLLETYATLMSPWVGKNFEFLESIKSNFEFVFGEKLDANPDEIFVRTILMSKKSA